MLTATPPLPYFLVYVGTSFSSVSLSSGASWGALGLFSGLGVRWGFLQSCCHLCHKALSVVFPWLWCEVAYSEIADYRLIVVGALCVVALGVFVVGVVGVPGGWWPHQKVQVVVCGLTVMSLSLSVVF